MMSPTNSKPIRFAHYAFITKTTKASIYFFIVLSAFTGPALASPVSTSYPIDATRGQSQEVARCMVAAVHYVSNDSAYEHIRWPKDDPDAIRQKNYYQDGNQVSEIAITAEGHVRDFKITDTYEPVTVYCMEIDNRIFKLKISPAVPQ